MFLEPNHVRQELAKKSSRDPHLVEWGARTHQYRLNPPIIEEEILRIERSNGVSLPGDYRHFLVNVGNGGAGPGFGLCSLETSLTCADDPTELENGTEVGDEFVRPVFDQPDWVGGTGEIVLCEHGCSQDDCLVITGPDAGTVWQFMELLGHTVPLLKKMPVPKRRRGTTAEDAQRAWARRLFVAKRSEQMSFTDWYLDWLETPPHLPWYKRWAG